MGDKYLDWLFKYSNMKGSSKVIYDLFLYTAKAIEPASAKVMYDIYL